MSPIKIDPIGAKSSHLTRSPIVHYQDNAELEANWDRIGKHPLHHLRWRIGRDIKVFGLKAQQAVADTATGEVGNEAVVTQGLYDMSGAAFFFIHARMVACEVVGCNVDGRTGVDLSELTLPAFQGLDTFGCV
jgi:hypothetical protein